MKRLGDAELEIMETIWAEKEPVTAACILKNLKTRNTWALSSLMTALARLTEKGFVCCDRKYRHNLYTALIGEEDYKAYQGRTLLDRLYGSSVTKMVANLVRKEKLSREDVEILREYLDQLKTKENEKHS